MVYLMPVNQDVENTLKETIVNDPMGSLFKDPETFIKVYNSGLINKQNETVVNLFKSLLKTYKNVKERNRKIVIVNNEEVYVDEISYFLKALLPVVKIKNELLDNNVQEDTSIFFDNKNIGKILVKNGIELEPLTGFKLYSSQEEITSIHDKYSSVNRNSGLDSFREKFGNDFEEDEIAEDIPEVKDDNYTLLEFKAKDFLHFDTSFLEEMHNLIP